MMLWDLANEEHPNDPDARRERYIDLMVEHGHIVKAKPGQDRNLPCGWPGNRQNTTAPDDADPSTVGRPET